MVHITVEHLPYVRLWIQYLAPPKTNKKLQLHYQKIKSIILVPMAYSISYFETLISTKFPLITEMIIISQNINSQNLS